MSPELEQAIKYSASRLSERCGCGELLLVVDVYGVCWKCQGRLIPLDRKVRHKLRDWGRGIRTADVRLFTID